MLKISAKVEYKTTDNSLTTGKKNKEKRPSPFGDILDVFGGILQRTSEIFNSKHEE